MEKQKDELMEKRISVLLWLKALNDFKGEGYEDSTFHEKYEAFDEVEETEEFSSGEYEDGVSFWIAKGIIVQDDITDELSVSEQGEKLFGLINSKSDKEASRIIMKQLSNKKKIDLKEVLGVAGESVGIIAGLIGMFK